MRFRRGKVQGNETITPGRLPGIWRRRLMVLTLMALIFGMVHLVREIWIQADGRVVGNTTSISSLYPGRVTKVFVECNTIVKAGQPIIKIYSEEQKIRYTDRITQIENQKWGLMADMNQSADAVEIAKLEHNKALSVLAEKTNNWRAFNKLFKQGAVNRTEWDRARDGVMLAEATVLTSEARWRAKLNDYDRAEKKAINRSQDLNARLKLMKEAVELQGGTVLKAPQPGLVTGCRAQPGETLDAKVVAFTVFDAANAYIQSYFNPEHVNRLSKGMIVEVSITGMEQSFQAPILSVNPTIATLPASMIRYFWQEPQWSQYLPVRISLEKLPKHLLTQIRYKARVRVSLVQLPSWLKQGLLLVDDAGLMIKDFYRSLVGADEPSKTV